MQEEKIEAGRQSSAEKVDKAEVITRWEKLGLRDSDSSDTAIWESSFAIIRIISGLQFGLKESIKLLRLDQSFRNEKYLQCTYGDIVKAWKFRNLNRVSDMTGENFNLHQARLGN